MSDAAAQGDRSENAEYIYGKKRLREIDRRVHFLRKPDGELRNTPGLRRAIVAVIRKFKPDAVVVTGDPALDERTDVFSLCARGASITVAGRWQLLLPAAHVAKRGVDKAEPEIDRSSALLATQS